MKKRRRKKVKVFIAENCLKQKDFVIWGKLDVKMVDDPRRRSQ